MMTACALRPADPPDVMHRVHDGLPLVRIICTQLRRTVGPVMRMDDLVSFGYEGLLAAARTFDPGRGVPFRRWANIRIRGMVLDGIRSSAVLPRSIYSRLRALEAAHLAREGLPAQASALGGSAEAADRALGDYLAGAATAMALGFRGCETGEAGEATDREPSVENALLQRELFAAIRKAITELPDAERTLLERHYFDDVTFEHAAAELGLSKSWASRLHSRAIGYVTRSLKRSRAV